MPVQIKMSGFNRSLQELEKALKHWKGKRHVTVGVHDGGGQQDYGNGMNTAEIAAKNHFGSGRIPARPFLDNGVMRMKDVIASSVTYQMADGATPDEVLKSVGALAVRGVVKQIDETLTPPNSPVTIARKGSAHPLIDTGNLRQSITFKVKNGNL